MTDDVIDLDKRRGMASQVATDRRRLLADVEANERDLRLQRDALESQLLATLAVNWREAAVKALHSRPLCRHPGRWRRSAVHWSTWCWPTSNGSSASP